jgi:hypothetical protein
MNAVIQQKINFLGHKNIFIPSSLKRIAEREQQLDVSAETSVATRSRLPAAIPDERLDYYAWVFHQGGFSSLKMTFEQFLTVVAAVHPSGLYPDYDPTDIRHEHFA